MTLKNLSEEDKAKKIMLLSWLTELSLNHINTTEREISKKSLPFLFFDL